MNLMRIDPYRELSTFQDRLSRVLGSSFGRTERDDETLAAWVPPVDIAEEKDRILITAELPGFKDNEISITTENGMLTISGERKFEKEENGKNYHRVERAYGRFARSFSLPNNVDRERIQAKFQNGLLQIDLPKREDAKPRTIRITEGDRSQSDKPKGTIDVQARA
jgi:HSP20 family protein